MANYFAIPDSGTGGDGSSGNPWKLGDLCPATSTQSTASAALVNPDDVLRLRGGTYDFAGSSAGNDGEAGILCPGGSGLPGHPITIRNYETEDVQVVRTAGKRPLAGNAKPNLTAYNYCCIKGITFRTENGVINAAIKMRGNGNGTATGNEVAYCTVVGDAAASIDNHEGLRSDYQIDPYYHHLDLGYMQGTSKYNAAGIKLYYNQNALVEDVYAHHNRCGGFDKDGSDGNTWRRCYFVNNTTHAFVATEFGYIDSPSLTIEHSILDKYVWLTQFGRYCTIKNNLILSTSLSRQSLALSRQNTAQAGGASTITLDAGAAAKTGGGAGTQPYEGFMIFLVSGTGAGQAREVVDYDGDTKVVTVGSPWGTVPDSSTGFYIGYQPYSNTVRDNVLLSPSDSISPHDFNTGTFPNYAGFPNSLLAMDRNLYITPGTASYACISGSGNKSLAQMQAAGYDLNSTFVSGGSAAAFDDEANYVLKSAYTAVGTDSGKPGPADPATILDTSRYGAAALMALDGGTPIEVFSGTIVLQWAGKQIALRVS